MLTSPLPRSCFLPSAALPIWLLTLGCAFATRLECNICYASERQEDCHVTSELCRPEHVCYIQVEHVTRVLGNGEEQRLTLYTMGCEHVYLCRDRTSYGPTVYGYGRIERFCCCSHHCSDADGTGNGGHLSCPQAWRNSTSASSCQVTATSHDVITLTLACSLVTKLLFYN